MITASTVLVPTNQRAIGRCRTARGVWSSRPGRSGGLVNGVLGMSVCLPDVGGSI